MSAGISRFRELMDKYLEDRALRSELEELYLLLQSRLHDEELDEHIAENWESDSLPPAVMNEDRKKEILSAIIRSMPDSVETDGRRSFLYRYRWLAAACLLALIGVTFLWRYSSPVKGPETVAEATRESSIQPGGTKALLTLDDGSVIVLNDKPAGELARQGAASVMKEDSGTVGYKGTGGSSAYNTLRTPRGGQYSLVLGDGSKVWLNAATSLRFPVSFNGNERTVELDGEAYFEIAHDSEKPFYVKTPDGARVEVTGTHFNVMAYPDESVRETTLLEGGINISKGALTRVLKPGQQAKISFDGITVIDKQDPEESIAWKNGLISFRDADIKTIMRQAARWYDVDVEYQGEIPRRIFTGSLLRSASLKELLQILELSKVKFSIEGRTIIVSG